MTSGVDLLRQVSTTSVENFSAQLIGLEDARNVLGPPILGGSDPFSNPRSIDAIKNGLLVAVASTAIYKTGEYLCPENDERCKTVVALIAAIGASAVEGGMIGGLAGRAANKVVTTAGQYTCPEDNKPCESTFKILAVVSAAAVKGALFAFNGGVI